MSKDATYLLDDNSVKDRDIFRKLSSLRPRRLHGFDEISKAARGAAANDRWIALHSALATYAVRAAAEAGRRLGVLLILDRPEPSIIAPLTASFRRVVFSLNPKTFLPPEELAEVLTSDQAGSLFIGGAMDQESQTITLWRGDGSSLVVPMNSFPPSGEGLKPDFKKFKVTDYGQTLSFGAYEASADAVLFENDGDFRREVNKRRRQEDRGFGPSLRRLRLLKGLSRQGFAPLSSKTIARIEQSHTEKPRGKTLKVIEKRLGLSSDEIETY